MMASMLVHGVEFWQGLEYRDFLTGRWRTFKNLPGELQFIPGWEAKGRFGAADSNKDIDVAVYRKDGALLVIIANYAKQAVNAKVKMDLDSLIRKPGPKEVRGTYDFETMENPGYVWQPDGTFQLKVAARDFRVLLIQNEIPGLGGHF
jgi:hypothetical protein